jgi:hypothetical protein
MKISSIHWGEDSAENDPQLLQYFINSDALVRLTNNNKQIVIGRKGAGKSAARRKLESHFTEQPNTFVISITPSPSTVRTITNDREVADKFGEEMFFSYVWLRHIARSCLAESGRNANSLSLSGSKAFARDVAQTLNQSNNGLIEAVADLVNRIKIEGGELGSLGLNIEAKLRDLTDTESLCHHLSQLASAGEHFVVCVDDLDHGWNNTNVTNAFLLGLLAASQRLKAVIPGIMIYLFVREDVYNILVERTQHSDKYRNIEHIRWTPEKLKDVLCKRITFNINTSGGFAPPDPFGEVFPETIGTSNTDNWLMERTLLRPRELIQLCRLYTESVDGERPDADKLKEAEKSYSEWKLEDIANEFTHQYPDIGKLFSFWKSKYFRCKYHLSKSEITPMLERALRECRIKQEWWQEIASAPDGSVAPLLDVLYDIGFLGDFIKGGQGGSKTVYSFEGRHEPRFDEVQIHPCFRKAIGTVERIRSSEEKSESRGT